MISKTIGDILDETAKKFPDKDALIYIDRNLRLTYKDLKEKCDKLAKGLIALKIKRGDHIAIWAYNIPEWVMLQFASAKIGAILVTVNTYYKSHELGYLLKQSDATTLFLVKGFKDVNYVETLYKIIPSLKDTDGKKANSADFPYLKNIVYIGKEQNNGMYNFEDILELADNISDEELKKVQQSLDPHDVINMQYTSGTTGFPKGVMLTHYNILNNAYHVGENMKIDENDRMCIPVPFFHCFGCVISILNCVIHGSAMVPIEIFNSEKVLESVEKEKCTVLQGVPTMFIAELQNPNFNKYDLSSLRTGIMAGAPCPIEVMVNVISKMNLREITICYGLTEASPVLTQTKRNDPVAKRVETVGKALPGIEVKIVDSETGQDLPSNIPGELVAKGYSIMKGYYKMPKQSQQVIIDGWLHTKDLAIIDDDGYFSILGRIDDMIIRGGENVYPREIEEYLYTNNKIEDVAIVGVPDKKYGEEVCAFVILHEGEKAFENEIRDFCMEGVSRFKIPKYVFFVDSFPLTASGKVRKMDLRKFAQEKLNSM